MASAWSRQRKTLYGGVAGTLVLVVLVWVFLTFFTTAPTCFDGTQNGSERGVDCGGGCALVCRSDAKAPVVLWSRVFQTSPGYYTAAAYVQNNNPGAGAKQVSYSFQLFDSTNTLIIERGGLVDLPPVQTIPIIEPNIPVKNQTVARVLFGFSVIPTWEKIPQKDLPSLRVAGQGLAADGSRLEAVVENSSLIDASGVTVGAVLFDASGTAVAASKSSIDVAKKSAAPVVFTWPGGVLNVVRAEITVLPSF